MSNLRDATEHPEDAEEVLDVEAEIDDDKRVTLLAILDDIQRSKHDLEELEE